jgi:uncharacterized membrane protein YfcA
LCRTCILLEEYRMVLPHAQSRDEVLIAFREVLVAIAGFVGGFVSILASNGSSLTLPALEFFGLPEHVANGTNRLSVVALGLMGTIHFYREGLVEWRKGTLMAVLIASGTIVGSIAGVDLSDAALDAIVIAGLLLVLGMLLLGPSRWLQGKGGSPRAFDWIQALTYFAIGVYAGLVVLGSGFFILAALVLLSGYDLRHANAMKAFVLLVVGLQSLFIFEDRGEVDWVAGIPLALGSASGAYAAALLVAKAWAKVWVYRFLVLAVLASIGYLIMTDSGKVLQLA